MFAAWCGIEMRTPAARSASTVAPSRMSEPVTRKPASTKSLAMPLIPAPPIPTKCTAPSSSGTCWEKSDLIIVTNLLFCRGAVSLDCFAHECVQPVGIVLHIFRVGAGGHFCNARAVQQQWNQHARNPFRGEVGVLDDDRPARVDDATRSEERRVGKEGRSRWGAWHATTKR